MSLGLFEVGEKLAEPSLRTGCTSNVGFSQFVRGWMPPSERETDRQRQRERSPDFDVELLDGAAMPLLGHCLYLVLARLDLALTYHGCLLDSNTVALRGVSSLGRDFDMGSKWGKSRFVD